MRTAEERINAIHKQIATENEKALAEERKRAEENARLENEIVKLFPRIETLILVAEELLSTGRLLPRGKGQITPMYMKYDGYFDYPTTAIAEGFYHHVGFIKERNKPITEMGIDNGGARGHWDLRVSPEKGVYEMHDENGRIRSATNEMLNRFLKEFPVFEKAFYEWFDKKYQNN